jgi:Ca2+-binding EF-hand superfamily protein
VINHQKIEKCFVRLKQQRKESLKKMGDEESQWKDVWNLYDTDRTGKVKKEEFMDCVRVCTRRYPLSVLQEKCKDYGDTISYETFFDFMMRPYDGPGREDLERQRVW